MSGHGNIKHLPTGANSQVLSDRSSKMKMKSKDWCLEQSLSSGSENKCIQMRRCLRMEHIVMTEKQWQSDFLTYGHNGQADGVGPM